MIVLNTNKKAFSFLELLIVILIIWLLAANAQPYDYRRPDPNRQAQDNCHRILRNIQGALDMYNMDNSTMMETAFPGIEYDRAEKLLIDNKYLKPYEKGVYCEYGIIDAADLGSVYCVVHGKPGYEYESDQNPIYPDIGTDSKELYYQKYENLKSEMTIESKKAKSKIAKFKIARKKDFVHILLESPFVPAVIILLIFLNIAYILYDYFLKKTNKS